MTRQGYTHTQANTQLRLRVSLTKAQICGHGQSAGGFGGSRLQIHILEGLPSKPFIVRSRSHTFCFKAPNYVLARTLTERVV